VDKRLQALGAGNGWSVDGRFVTVAVAAGRVQTVRCEEVDEGDGRMIRVSTIVGEGSKMSETRLRAALGLNWRIRYGALAIHDKMLVMTHFFTDLKVSDATLAEVIQYLAMTAATYETHLVGSVEG
jgi:hypothetical protein